MVLDGDGLRTRRQVLGSLGAGVLGLPLASSEALGSGRVPVYDYVVVGAGLAGLACAYQLAQQGARLLLVEAGAGPGGRVRTARQPFLSGQSAELGASLIGHADLHPHVHDYARLCQLDLEEVGYDDPYELTYYMGARRFPESQLQSILSPRAYGDLARFQEELVKLAEAIGDPTGSFDGLNQSSWDRETAEGWLQGLRLHQDAATLARHFIRGEYNEPYLISKLFLAQQARLYLGRHNDLELYRVRGGNDQIATGLLNRLQQSGVTTLFRHRLAYMRRRRRGGFFLELQEDMPRGVLPGPHSSKVPGTYSSKVPGTYGESRLPGPRRVGARRLVMACALPAAQAVQGFDECVRATHKLRRLQRPRRGVSLNYAAHVKVLLQYQSRFWLDQLSSGDTIADTPLGWAWESSDQQGGDQGLLTTYSSGDHAIALGRSRFSSRVNRQVNAVDQVYPGSQAQFLGPGHSASLVWHQARGFGGAFSAYAPGQMRLLWDIWQNQSGADLAFCGEHTSPHVGFMEGALESGTRLAQQLEGGRPTS